MRPLTGLRRAACDVVDGRSVVLLLFGAAGAGLLLFLHVPAGGILGAVLGAGLISIWRPGTPLTASYRIAGLLLLGILAGAGVTTAVLSTLAGVVLPLLAAMLLLFGVTLGLALLTARFTDIDRGTALFAFAPGGISEIVPMAAQYHVGFHQVLTVHLLRVLVVVLVGLPLLVHLLG